MILSVLIGLITGFVTGLTGASGVMVVVPLAHYLLLLPVHDAIGTSLMADVIASCAVSYAYYRHGNTDLRSGIFVAAGAILGAQVSAGFAVAIPENSLGILFGGGMMVTSLILVRRGSGRVAGDGSFSTREFRFRSPSMRTIMALFLGYCLGTMTGIFGSGGGIMAFMILFFILDYPVKKAIGTSTLIMAVTALSGCMAYASNGKISPSDGLIIGFAAVAGGFMSARIANRLDEKKLIKVLGIIFVLMGLFMTVHGLLKFLDYL